MWLSSLVLRPYRQSVVLISGNYTSLPLVFQSGLPWICHSVLVPVVIAKYSYLGHDIYPYVAIRVTGVSILTFYKKTCFYRPCLKATSFRRMETREPSCRMWRSADTSQGGIGFPFYNSFCFCKLCTFEANTKKRLYHLDSVGLLTPLHTLFLKFRHAVSVECQPIRMYYQV